LHALQIANNSSYAVLLKKSESVFPLKMTTLVSVLEEFTLVQTMLVGKGLADFLRSVGEGVGEAVGRYFPTTDSA